MTEAQTITLLNKMTIPSGYTFSKEEVATLLDLDSPPDPTVKKKKKTSAKLGERELKKIP